MLTILFITLGVLLPACSGVSQESLQTDSPPISESEDKPLEIPSNKEVARNFYKYSIEDAKWDTQEANFPPAWISVAATVVQAEEKVDFCIFTRGWIYDFDKDGNKEAILLFKWGLDDEALYQFGDSSFVYVNSQGDAQFLTGGCDESYNDWNRMDACILQYAGFEHILIHSGNQTMTSGSWEIIYRITDGGLEQLISNLWGYVRDNGVFLETIGPQGQGSGFYFWDEMYDRYSAIGPVEIRRENFIKLFEGGQVNLQSEWSYANLEGLVDYNINIEEYQVDQIEKIEVYGNRYYQLYFYEDSEVYGGAYGMAWIRNPENMWELFWGPYGGPMNSPAYGIIGEDNLVYDVDMTNAEKNAIPANAEARNGQ